jgi:hypothetical protein
MKIREPLFLGALSFALLAAPAFATTVPLSNGGTVSPSGGGLDTGDSVGPDELDSMFDNGGEAAGSGGFKINRTIAVKAGKPAAAHGSARAKSNPELVRSYDGVNFHDQRYANGGNNFSVEPPDQALCAGNGFVFESTNDVLRIFDSSGHTLVGPLDLNTFYGYPPAINRRTGARGPSITDPTCLFDNDTQRFFHVVLTIERSGANHLDIAVSNSADPTQGFTVHSLPVQNDGTQGTPNHGCPGGPCLGDYPHIGADANAFFITTNEFALFAPGFNGAQVYAISKRALAANASSINAVLFDTSQPQYLDSNGAPGFTVWPAIAAPGSNETANGGTEYLLSSDAVFYGSSNQVRKWSVTNTSSIDSNPGALALSNNFVPTEGYGVPGPSNQKAGTALPLRDCIANAPCAAAIGAGAPYYNQESVLDSSDSRMQQVFLANGKLWSGLDTGLLFNDGSVSNGIAYFVINPNANKAVQQGYIGLPGNNVTYPAVAVTASGRGVIAFTLTGNDFYPSAGYASLDAKIGAGDVHVAAAGLGPQDGFSGYLPFSDRPRWGDYGAAALDGNSIWIASEYIGQTCTFAEYNTASPSGRRFTCGETRGALGNWGTRITQLGF